MSNTKAPHTQYKVLHIPSAMYVEHRIYGIVFPCRKAAKNHIKGKRHIYYNRNGTIGLGWDKQFPKLCKEEFEFVLVENQEV